MNEKKSNTQVINWLIDWFNDNSTIEKENISNNLETNYLEKAWIDSFKFIKLISDIEAEFNIKIDNENFQNSIIFTINGLMQMVKENE